MKISAEEQCVIDKYTTYKKVDPFPDIPAALLNSADIHSYVNATGMIYPFNEEALKSASYAARIAGECRYWDEESEEFKPLMLSGKGDKLILRPNSIAFVGIEPTFRLPDYIALRFNLKITNVYQGLLLGTGPLIDPGFEGKITIPLHNLTNNEYVFPYGEALIWIEFTKTSPILSEKDFNDIEKDSPKEKRCREYKEFPENKKYKQLDYYLSKALEGYSFNRVVSSIPAAIAETKKSADDAKISASLAKDEAGKIAKFTILGTAVGAVAVVASIIGILCNVWSLQKGYLDQAVSKSVIEIEQSQKNDINKIVKDISESESRSSNSSTKVYENINSIIEQQNKTMSSLINRIEQLEKGKKLANSK